MEMIYPLAIALDKTGSSPTYVYAAWATSTAYARNQIIRYEVSSVWYDFRCEWAHTSSSSRTPYNPYYWTLLGPASTTGGYTYVTNVRLSNAATWTSGAAVVAGAVQYDPADNHDYQALIAISANDNTVRPSEAVLSSNETIAARWSDIGAANAWAPFDYYLNSYLYGYDTNGAYNNPAFTIVSPVNTGTVIDRICFAGLQWVKSIKVEVYLNGNKTETITKSQEPPAGISAAPYKAAVVKLTTVNTWDYTSIKFVVTLTASDTNIVCKCGAIVIGPAIYLGETEWDVTTKILSFSRKERNQDFGTVKFVKRGSAKGVSAVGYLDPAIMPGDIVQQHLQFFDGMPLFFDFNNAGSNYDRLRVFGFYTKVETVIKAVSFESILIDIEGLVD